MAAAVGILNWAANGGGVNLLNGFVGVAPQLCVGWLCLKLVNNVVKGIDVAGKEGKRVIHVVGDNIEQAVKDTRIAAAEFLDTAGKIALVAGAFDAGCYVVSDVPVLKYTLQGIATLSTLKFAADKAGVKIAPKWEGKLEEKLISLSSTLAKCAICAIALFGHSTICSTNPDMFFCSMASMSTVASMDPAYLALGVSAVGLGAIVSGKFLMRKDTTQNSEQSNDESSQLEQMFATWEQNHADNLAAHAAAEAEIAAMHAKFDKWKKA